jgi:hypothetical protein
MTKQFERRLRRIEQHYESLAKPKKWLPQWLIESWEKATGMPFDTPENAALGFRRFQEMEAMGMTDPTEEDDDSAYKSIFCEPTRSSGGGGTQPEPAPE